MDKKLLTVLAVCSLLASFITVYFFVKGAIK